MTTIEEIVIRKIMDSRGKPTVEVEVFTPNGVGVAAAPSGASTGEHEVMAFPEKGVDAAIEQFRKIVIPELLDVDTVDQRYVDRLLHELDGTPNFAKLGGNVSVATSIAVAKAAADSLCMPLYAYLGGTFANRLPYPMGNVIGGGAHAVGGTDIQEYLAVSMSSSASKNVFSNALVHRRIKEKLTKKFPNEPIGKGDEGAWTVKLGNEDALKLVAEVCDTVSDEEKIEVRPAIDFAASEFYKDGKYVYKRDNKSYTTDEQVKFVASLVDKYKLFSVEDPLEQNDYEGYMKLTKEIGDRCIVIGDDIFTTNKARLKKGIEMHAANAILIKPNQIGTLTDMFETIDLAHRNEFKTVVSHRSGETCDETIAHIAVAFGAIAIKTGTVGGERGAKLNELIRIQEDLEAASEGMEREE